MSADDAGVARSTAGTDAERYARESLTGTPKGDIGGRREVEKPTDRLNVGEG
jgi:hypothetical protein